jgi:predicted secreted protein
MIGSFLQTPFPAELTYGGDNWVSARETSATGFSFQWEEDVTLGLKSRLVVPDTTSEDLGHGLEGSSEFRILAKDPKTQGNQSPPLGLPPHATVALNRAWQMETTEVT